MIEENEMPNENTTIKDFMEWYVYNYPDNQYVLPSDYEKTADRLTGYALAKKNTEESYILDAAVSRLNTAMNFFRLIKQYGKWKFTV